jgi:hypothetical protein
LGARENMKTSIVLSVLVSMLVGAAIGGWYASKKSEEEFAYSRMEQLYRESAMEIKTYAKLLRLSRSGEKERVLKYLEALLGSAETTLAVTKNDIPEEVQLTVGDEAINYLSQYRTDYPVEVEVAP